MQEEEYYSDEDIVQGSTVLDKYQQSFVSQPSQFKDQNCNLKQDQLILQLVTKNQEIEELKTELALEQSQIDIFAKQKSPGQSMELLELQKLKNQNSGLEEELKEANEIEQYEKAELERLKTLLLMREREISILTTKKVEEEPEKIPLSEKAEILLKENEKLTRQLVENRKKLTKEQFVEMINENNEKAVEIELKEILTYNNDLQKQNIYLSQQNEQYLKCIKSLEEQAVEVLEVADSEYRKELAGYKTDIFVLQQELDQKDRNQSLIEQKEREYAIETSTFKEIAEMKDNLIEEKTNENIELEREMASKNIELRGVVQDISGEISNKLAAMKRENIRIEEQFEELNQNKTEDTKVKQKMNDIYEELDELKGLCGLQ